MRRRVSKLFIAMVLVAIAAMLYPALVADTGAEGVKEIPPDKTVLAIYSVEAKGTEASLAEALTPHLIMVINKYRGKIKIVQNEAVQKALDNVGMAASGACTDTECLPALGKILGANRFLVTSLSKLKAYTIYSSVYDAESGALMFTEFEKSTGSVDDLPDALDRLAARVMARLNGKKVEKLPTKPDKTITKPEVEPIKEDLPKPQDIKFIPATAEDQKKCPEGMVYVPAGWFMMGCNAAKDSQCEQDEYPYHPVYLDAYCIDKYEYPNQKGLEPKPRVSWNDAQSTCSSLGKRLPTEAEWEKAARGTDGRTYPWGEGIDHSKAKYQRKGKNRAEPSGSYEVGVSPYGAYDMAGNLWEWVQDWYGESYYQVSPSHNPVGPSSGTHRVLRGGSWFNIPNILRTSLRFWNYPNYWHSLYGFRCAKDSK